MRKLSSSQIAVLRSIQDKGCLPISYEPAVYSGLLRTAKSLQRLALIEKPFMGPWKLTHEGRVALAGIGEGVLPPPTKAGA